MAHPKTKVILGSVFAMSAVVAGLVFHASRPADRANRVWQARAEATADDPEAARQVIVDSIYANKTLDVAEAYGMALQQRPTREARIANFAHAVEVANRYSDPELTNPASPYFRSKIDPNVVLQRRAVGALKSIVEPPDNTMLHTQVQTEEARNFKPTKIADAWLAWAEFRGYKYLMYQRAARLDPSFGEAYYGMAHCIYYQSKLPAKVKKALALQDLDKADRLEPALHPLITNERYWIAFRSGDNKTAIAYLGEYLRLWPTAFHADMLRRQLAQMKAEQKHEAT